MNFGFWNVRGMNREGKQKVVHNFLQANNVGLFGLLESKVKPNNLTKDVSNVFHEWSVSTNTTYHKGGRIWILWKPHLYDIQFLEYNPQYIHMYVVNKNSQDWFFHTIVYAFNGALLSRGDFNCVLQATERLRGQVSLAESAPFQDCLDWCQLMDIKASGAFYTWNNKQPPETRKYSRLDRFLVNKDWMDQLPAYFANFLPEGLFDHTPCLVSKNTSGGNKNRPFKYFNMWSKAPGFLNCVAQGWNKNVVGTKMYKVVRKLKLLKTDLKQLNKNTFSDIENKTDLAQTQLLHIQQQLMRNPGDTDHEGGIHTEEASIQQAFLNYYQMLLGTQNSTKKVKYTVVQRGKVCTEQQQQTLMTPITPEEIKHIIFLIPNDKAPGPDGYSSKFFKDSWDVVGNEVTEAVLDFFQSGCLLKQLHATIVTLIPKVNRPVNVVKYRPIACYNVIYKCISKVLCSRLAVVLPELISPNQGGFIKGISIMENILICQDIVRLYERNAASPRCLFKMDLQKAYDTIEWVFLDDMLQALKFQEQYRKWIMQCVTNATDAGARGSGNHQDNHKELGLTRLGNYLIL
ncbi:uncharacterized protein LOC141619026 [Silene latifolia]|uniref:uncharacterized protein LOC141619026 n=1 Tax=Silene latifolia TaxID=37657 RepID=UPI003D7783FE